MTATADFDRLLMSWLQSDGPTEVRASVVDGALASARRIGQRRTSVAWLLGETWPGQQVGLRAPAVRRAALLTLGALLAVALVAAAVVIGSRLREPSGGLHGRVAYIQDGDVWLADTSGTGAIKLMDSYLDFQTVHWLPDGQLAVGWERGVTLVDLASGAQRDLDDDAGGDMRAWSPDGRSYAYLVDGASDAAVHYVDVVSGDQWEEAVTPSTGEGAPLDVSSLAWSPDGLWLVASAMEPWRTMVIDATNGAATEIAADDAAEYAWSPDAERIVYQVTDASLDRRLVVQDRRGGGAVQIADLDLPRGGGDTEWKHLGLRSTPSWSPDGQWIAFRRAAMVGPLGLTIVRPNGSDRRDLVSGPVTWYQWSPDSAGLSFIEADGVDAAGGELRWVGIDGRQGPSTGLTDVGAYDVLDRPASQGPPPSPTAILTPVPSQPSGPGSAVTTPVAAPPADPGDAWRGLAVLTGSSEGGCPGAFGVGFDGSAPESLVSTGCAEGFAPDGRHLLLTKRDPEGRRTDPTVIDLATGATRSIDAGGLPVSWAAWSPAGMFLALGAAAPVVVRPDGTERTLLSERLSDGTWGQLAWAPNDSRIAVLTSGEGLLVGDGGAKDLHPMIDPPSGLARPGAWSWAPDGRRFALVCDGGLDGDVCTDDADGGNLQRVVDARFGGLTPGSWAPDGSRILVSQGHELWLYETETWTGRKLADLPEPPIDAGLGGFFWTPVGRYEGSRAAWSPDGRWIALASTDHVDLLMPDGSGTTRIEDAFHVAWSPDGRFLAILSDNDDGSFRLDIANGDGSGRHARATLDGSAGQVVWLPDR